ncbi:hypothetical protein H920_20086 [Fukomys damarensis]|uniref:Uncharacterized protein n=1 Tax=Fukomys damarensis TaxID=885580 RepID=A0A091CL72_FUKDA|nr:hypothetical protein H920_20086 [Fukomys damarensis]
MSTPSRSVFPKVRRLSCPFGSHNPNYKLSEDRCYVSETVQGQEKVLYVWLDSGRSPETLPPSEEASGSGAASRGHGPQGRPGVGRKTPVWTRELGTQLVDEAVAQPGNRVHSDRNALQMQKQAAAARLQPLGDAAPCGPVCLVLFSVSAGLCGMQTWRERDGQVRSGWAVGDMGSSSTRLQMRKEKQPLSDNQDAENRGGEAVEDCLAGQQGKASMETGRPGSHGYKESLSADGGVL